MIDLFRVSIKTNTKIAERNETTSINDELYSIHTFDDLNIDKICILSQWCVISKKSYSNTLSFLNNNWETDSKVYMEM